MTPREFALLLSAGDSLGASFQHNRDRRARTNESELDRAMREREAEKDRQLRREEFGQRGAEFAEESQFRREEASQRHFQGEEGLELRRTQGAATEAHQKRMEAYQKALAEARDDDAKFSILGEMNKEGLLTDEGVNAMSEALNKKLGSAGLGVKLFKRGTGITQKEAPFAEIEEPLGDVDPLTGKAPGSIKRRIPESQVPQYLQQRGRAVEEGRRDKNDAAAAGPTPEQEAEMEAILKSEATPAYGPPPGKQSTEDRVDVIAPDGKRGSIPRSQLEAAKAKGYKLATPAKQPPEPTNMQHLLR